MGHFFSKVSLFIDKKEAAAHLILDQDFATAPMNLFIFEQITKSKTAEIIGKIEQSIVLISKLE